MILLGVLAVGILLWFGPSAKRSVQNSPKGTSSDWMGLAVILGIVVFFVFLLIAIV